MQLTKADLALQAAVFRALPEHQNAALGVAVSGGGDSIALLNLLAQGAALDEAPVGLTLKVATVDHGLRPGARAEAQRVAQLCADLGLPHEILTWTGWDGQGNLQAKARSARYGLLAKWAKAQGLGAVALGHTRDDLAETFLMRLARRSGVQGLAAMSPQFEENGIVFARPLLGTSRAALRDHLIRQGVSWSEDPSNEDARFDRVRVRNTLKTLAEIGLDDAVLAEVAGHMRSADDALRAATVHFAASAVTADRGDLSIDRTALLAAPKEITHRVLRAALCWVSGAAYGPRASNLQEVVSAALDGQKMTLHGCVLLPAPDRLRIGREPSAVQGPVQSGELWDARWRLLGPMGDPVLKGEVGALGDDIRQCDAWRAENLPRSSVMASPALRLEGRLICAPLAGFGADYTAELTRNRSNFHDFLLSH